MSVPSTDLANVLVSPTGSMRDTLALLDASGMQICLVVDEGRRLLGTISDGDIRRAILRGLSLDTANADMMNRSPLVASPELPRDELSRLMALRRVTQIPIVDGNGRVVRLQTLQQMAQEAHAQRPNWVVLMAGGLGTRLRPLTDSRPKPLLTVGDRPILQTILERCIAQNFNRFYISVNYFGEMIEDFFGDGSRWNVDIRYLREEKRMGTAGSLSLLPEIPTNPMVVMNADLLTEVNLGNLLAYHMEHQADATMGVREYDFQVPFGVVQTDNHRIVSVDEKPVHRFFVNAGVYALGPRMLKLVDGNSYLDMTELFNRAAETGMQTVAFPIVEHWIDIGRLEDYHRAQELVS